MRQQAKEKYVHLRQKIQDELSHFPELSEEIKQLLKEAHERGISTGHRRIAGSILHDFYTTIEKIFEAIAKVLDGGVPSSSRWHIELLENMASKSERGTRPNVIDDNLKEELRAYLGFRHLFRNIYASELLWDELEKLLVHLQMHLLDDIHQAMQRFDHFLEDLERDLS
ncbi:hypothetical protein H8E77_38630 [bacterium]|nr:hypothetical protein [bacterium]